MPALTTAQRIRATVGVAVIFGTWFYLVFTRPTDWESVGGSSPALITLGGYVLGAILLLSASLPILPARTIAIIPAALVLNIVIGQIVGSVGIPLYLDSVGTILVAGLAGPIAGLATGTLSSIVWGLFNPAALPFAAVSAMVGLLSGVMIAKGMLRNIPLTITAGVVLGIISGMLAAPVAAFVYGGTAGVGTGALVSLFREMGNSLIGSVTAQSLVSDPLDKALVMIIVHVAIRSLPKKTLASFHART
jgi:hypothetical protein